MLLKWLGILVFGGAIFAFSYAYNKKLVDWLRFQSLGTRDYIVERLSLMFIDIPPQRILMALFIFSFGLGSVVFLAFLPQLFPAIFFGAITTVIGWKSPKPIVDWLYNRRMNKLVIQMVDGLSLMSNGLKSGLSVVQAMGLVVKEMPNPLHQEFSLILSENNLGVSLEDAYNNFAKRVKSDDVEMFVTAVNILKETGGNLAESFDTIVTTIRERIKVEKRIEAMTAQSYYQGLFLMGIPPVFGLIFYLTDPEFMLPLFTTAVGWVIIFGIFLLQAVGFFFIMKIVKIEV
ncbi:type II secretion system F family protein [bacterium]|jgi:tight adherence protein B|nr:type II secretion system F family protein [bacterium]